MKKITLVLVVLLVACVTVKAQLVSPALPAGVVRAVAQKALEAKKKAEEAKKEVCYRCGQEITHANQHCNAANNTGLCSVEPAKEKEFSTNTNTLYCPKCGKKLTIDERFHGYEHVCQAQEETKTYCHRCGEEITHQGQHCDAANGVALCSATPAKHTETKVEMPATHCDKCGAQLSIDERFHGCEHVCKNNNTSKEYCHKCGEEITHQGQHCKATKHVGLCSATPVKSAETKVEMPSTHCDKCGAQLTVDERFHGIKHTCKK